MSSPSWIVNSPAAPANSESGESAADPGQIAAPPALPYTQTSRGTQLEAPTVVAGYARAATPVPITTALLRALKTRWKRALFFGLILGAIAATAMYYINPAKFDVKAHFKMDPSEPTVL